MRRQLLTAISITAFLLNPVTVTAAEWLYWDGSTRVDNEPVDIELGPNNEALRVEFLNESSIVAKGGCSKIDVYDFCFKSTSREENPDIDDEGRLRPGVKLEVEKEKITTKTDTGSPDMDISKTSTSLGVTDQQTITVRFQNTGDGAMFNFSGSVTLYNLTHELGDSEDIVSVGGDTYRTTGGIEAGANITIPVTVSLAGLQPSMKATYSYDTSNGSSVKNTENLSIETKNIYDATFNAPDRATLYDEQRITLTVKNNATTELAANTTMTHNGNQLFEPPEDTEKTIVSGDEATFTATYVPRYQGTGNITAQTTLDWGPNGTVTRNATINTPAPDVGVNAFLERADTGEDTQANITIQNNESMMLYQPTATIQTPFGDVVKQLAQNITHDTKQAHTVPLQLPLGVEPRTYNAQIVIRYTTKSDEQFKHEIDDSLIIEPIAYDIRLEKTFSDQTPSLNETVHVEVYAENMGIEELNGLTIEEQTTPNIYQGTVDVDLDPGARRRIYEYNVSYNGTPVTTKTRTNDDRVTVINTKTIDGETPPEQRRNRASNSINTTNETDDPRPLAPRPQSQNQTENEPDGAASRIQSFLNTITRTFEDLFSSMV